LSTATAIRRLIGRHRRSKSVERLHRIARFFEDAYTNVGTDFTEHGEEQLLNRLASHNFETVLDVGANVGEWSIAALRRWPASAVHAFEVAPQTFGLLRDNLHRENILSRVVLNQFGLAEAPTRRPMYYYPDRSDLTCDRPRHQDHASIQFTAEMITGDEYVKRSDIARIDFLKIDVEGSEHLVLQGFEDTLAGNRVRCIQFEYGAFAIDTRVLLRDFYDGLKSHYWIGKLFPSGVEFRDYSWTDEDFRFANYLCVSHDSPELKRAAECFT
jgi:FkbM family methyltransferase